MKIDKDWGDDGLSIDVIEDEGYFLLDKLEVLFTKMLTNFQTFIKKIEKRHNNTD